MSLWGFLNDDLPTRRLQATARRRFCSMPDDLGAPCLSRMVMLCRTMFAKRSAVVAASGALVLLAAWFYLRPAWESETGIRNALLKVTPLGTSMREVRSFAESRGWVQPDVRVDSYMAFNTGAGVDVSAFSGRLRHDPFPYRTAVASKCQSSLLTLPVRADKDSPCRASCALSLLRQCAASWTAGTRTSHPKRLRKLRMSCCCVNSED